MDYILHFEDGSTATLTHHGTKGMKWGKWNEETAARYAKDGKSTPSISGGGYSEEDEEENVPNVVTTPQYERDPEYAAWYDHYWKFYKRIARVLPASLSAKDKIKRIDQIYNMLWPSEKRPDFYKEDRKTGSAHAKVHTHKTPKKKTRIKEYIDEHNKKGIADQLTTAYLKKRKK